MISRRRFTQTSIASLAAAALVPHRVVLGQADHAGDAAPRDRADALYGLVMLGDLHYDQWHHHDMDWVRAEKPNDIRQIEGYVEVTNTHTPRLFERVAGLIRNAPVPIAGVVHIGDFVEGLCGSYELQALQSREAIAFVEGTRLGVPFLMAKGNHDITGPGSHEAFDDVLLPWMARNAGRRLDSASYTWRKGDDLFVFFDAYKPDLSWLESLDGEASRARHVFFVIHPPVVPYNARANWHVFSRESQAKDRERLIAWLGRHGAIALNGHLHRYCHLRRSHPNGGFSQFSVNSVVRHETERPEGKFIRSGVSDYGVSLLELNPDFAPHTIDERRAWLEREQPAITAFDYARVPGHAVLWVYSDSVEADVYLGYADDLWKRPVL